MGVFGRKKKDLVFEGIAGTATMPNTTRDERIHKVDESDDPVLADLGIGTRKYRLELDVQLDDKRPVYQASGHFKIPLDAGELDTGMTVPGARRSRRPGEPRAGLGCIARQPGADQLRDGFDAEEAGGRCTTGSGTRTVR